MKSMCPRKTHRHPPLARAVFACRLRKPTLVISSEATEREAANITRVSTKRAKVGRLKCTTAMRSSRSLTSRRPKPACVSPPSKRGRGQDSASRRLLDGRGQPSDSTSGVTDKFAPCAYAEHNHKGPPICESEPQAIGLVLELQGQHRRSHTTLSSFASGRRRSRASTAVQALPCFKQGSTSAILLNACLQHIWKSTQTAGRTKSKPACLKRCLVSACKSRGLPTNTLYNQSNRHEQRTLRSTAAVVRGSRVGPTVDLSPLGRALHGPIEHFHLIVGSGRPWTRNPKPEIYDDLLASWVPRQRMRGEPGDPARRCKPSSGAATPRVAPPAQRPPPQRHHRRTSAWRSTSRSLPAEGVVRHHRPRDGAATATGAGRRLLRGFGAPSCGGSQRRAPPCVVTTTDDGNTRLLITDTITIHLHTRIC